MTFANAIADALKYDEEDMPVQAAESYELAILEPHAEPLAFRNLIALYFVCLDPGYVAYHHLSNKFTDNIFERIISLPNEALCKNSNIDEMIFWRDYSKYLILGEQPEEIKWRSYIESGATLVPLFYFSYDIKRGKYANEVVTCRNICNKENTARTGYIRRILKI